jgi:hypothetical protein
VDSTIKLGLGRAIKLSDIRSLMCQMNFRNLIALGIDTLQQPYNETFPTLLDPGLDIRKSPRLVRSR